MIKEFKVDGMHCMKCVARIENTLLKEKYIKTVKCDLENSTVTIDLTQDVNDSTIIDILFDMGFDVI